MFDDSRMGALRFRRGVETRMTQRLREPRRHIQVLLGPRQVGKTTIAEEIFNSFEGPKRFLSADDPGLSESQNLDEVWRSFSKRVGAEKGEGLFVIDEVHKYSNWEKVVKARWDEDSREKINLKVLILGSAPLLIQKGLSESLAGRFEVLNVPHWSYTEVKNAFGLSCDEFIFYGGYPGSLNMIRDEKRWKAYVRDSLIETTISRDVLLLTRIDKPALMRKLFLLACEYSGQILSFQKMVGQLQDAGNTTTLAHYLELLSAVGFVKGLQKYSGSKILTRSSSPKLQVYNTGLLSALSSESFSSIRQSPVLWGRWVESAVGAHLLNQSMGTIYKVEYWKEGNFEVDFILSDGKRVVAIEVKSGRQRAELSGIVEINKKYKMNRSLVVGQQGLPLEDFLDTKIEDLF